MCAEGYQLGPDGSTCQDVDDCVKIPEVCEQVCHNTEGGFECRCYRGYEMVEGHCMPVPNCSTGPCDHMCEDVPGSYRCSCFVTDQLPNGVMLCVDIDECENNYCEHNCTNTLGSYVCHCKPGYVPFNINHCQPIPEDNNVDEFSGDSGPSLPDACHPNPCQGACQPRPGGFECICEAGYVLAPDGLHCEDVDECLEGPCKHECHNTAGSFYCSCQPGYQTAGPDGHDCRDEDECARPDACPQLCLNIPGSFRCICNIGYQQQPGSDACLDVDECLRDPCSGSCHNFPGSFKCTCPKLLISSVIRSPLLKFKLWSFQSSNFPAPPPPIPCHSKKYISL
uniref:EGF-like domain-containing protein n=1 Tax=Meleagris gallopavo TaxID=9103 RepID=A0A803YMN7_MELGA